MSTVELISGGLGIWALWIGWIESDNSGRRWLFEKDYREHFFVVVTFFFGVVTWWWVALRLTTVAIIFRHRNNEEMKMQFIILTVGVIIDGSAIATILAIPILRRVFKENIPWDEDMWYSHLVTSISMLITWFLVLLVGYGNVLSYLLFPCTDSRSTVCSILISYPG
jgi:hypothetical protein